MAGATASSILGKLSVRPATHLQRPRNALVNLSQDARHSPQGEYQGCPHESFVQRPGGSLFDLPAGFADKEFQTRT